MWQAIILFPPKPSGAVALQRTHGLHRGASTGTGQGRNAAIKLPGAPQAFAPNHRRSAGLGPLNLTAVLIDAGSDALAVRLDSPAM